MSLFKKLFSGSEKPDQQKQPKTADFSVGDIFYSQKEGTYKLCKLLAADAEFACYHILMYEPTDVLPTDEELNSLTVFAYHAPIDQHAFSEHTLLANRPVTAEDLIGYHEYLRGTQEPAYYVSIANGYYKAAIDLTNEHKHHEAIDSYSKAIDLFPPFFEAIDNRAFCKMDLGLWNEAIADFKLSLEQNPVSLLAEFSIGECYFKLGDFNQAKQQFEKAHEIDPDHPAPNQFLEKVNAILEK